MTGPRLSKAPQRETLWLIGLDDRQRVVKLPLSSIIRVGRADSNDLVLNDARISRHHSRFVPEREGYVVYDLNSVNGTFVNGQLVKRQRLKLDDIVRVGAYPFRVERDLVSEKRQEQRLRDPAPTIDNLQRVVHIVGSIDAKESGPRLVSVDAELPEDASLKLGTLYAFMQAISRTLDTAELLELVGMAVRDVYPTAAAVTTFLSEEREGAHTQLRLAHHAGSEPPGGKVVPPQVVTAAVVEAGRAILTTTAIAAVTRAGNLTGGKCMYAPLMDRGEVLGLIQVTVDERFDDFSEGDLDMLSAMASMVAIVLQNSRLHQHSLMQERLQHDLRLAAQIQKSFLPTEIVSVNGIEFLAEYRAAYQVGGDFYDVFWVAPDRLGVFIGDVSGKGVSAALLMARFSSELRVAAQAEIDPGAVLAIANRSLLARSGHSDTFYTAVYMTIDVNTGEIVIANGGHPTPYLVRADGSFRSIDPGSGSGVGFFHETIFDTARFKLEVGDSLVLYTDGIVEAPDGVGNLYGTRRLETCLSKGGAKPSDLADRLLSDVEEFAHEVLDRDDLTLLICHRGSRRGAGSSITSSNLDRRASDATVRARLADPPTGPHR